MSRRYVAFTLIEIVVVIAILVILAGIGIPAVLSARERSRQVGCQNNLHQIGIALQSFHNRNQRLPTTSFFFELRDELEISGVFSIPRSQLKATPSVMICPNDWQAASELPVNYYMNHGNRLFEGNGACEDLSSPGVLQILRFRDFTDGISSTAVVSERMSMSDSIVPKKSTERIAMRWWWKSPRQFDRGQESEFQKFYHDNLVGLEFDTSSAPWPTGFDSHFTYGHVLPPNSLLISKAIHREPFNVVNSAGSYHQRGVMVLMGDGSVNFASSDIDQLVWSAMGSRNGNDGLPQ